MTNLVTDAVKTYLRHREAAGVKWLRPGWESWEATVRKCLPGYLLQVPIQGQVAHWSGGDPHDQYWQWAAAILIKSPSVGEMLIDRVASEIKGGLHPQGINQAAIVAAGQVRYLGGSLAGWRTRENNIREDARAFMLQQTMLQQPVYLVIELWTSDLGATSATAQNRP
jgi:hypothetical protein